MKKIISLILAVMMLGTTASAEQWIYKGQYKLTGYCPCRSCSGGWGWQTASGVRPQEGITVAMSKEFPFGTKIYIEGVGYRICQDRGGAIKGKKIDVFCNSHKACFASNINRTSRVWVIK